MPALVTSTGGTLTAGINLKTYVQGGGGGNALNPRITGNIVGRLIPQEGAQFGMDEYRMDTLSIPYKIVRTDGWLKLLPGRGTAIADVPNMFAWDPLRNVSLGPIFVSATILCKGLINDAIPDPVIVDSVSLQTVTIAGQGGGSLGLVFYAPQTTYKYIVRGDPQGKPKYTTIQNTDSRPIRLERRVVNGTTDTDVPDSSFKEFLVAQIEEINVTTTSFQVGPYWCCQDVCIKTLIDPFSV